jgi:tartrate dehydrogenase/decarboxylase/D-malate dehydrogenase
VPDHVSVWELILPIRQRFEQYVNLRPMRLMPGVSCPLGGRASADIDMVCVRENSEGEYAGVGGRVHRGTAHEVAEQTGVFTRMGIERVVRYGFRVAQSRPRKMLASATKSNAPALDGAGDEVVEHGHRNPDHQKKALDALAARMVTIHKRSTMVASNLFGDILTDLGAAVSGVPAWRPGELTPSASINVRAHSWIGADIAARARELHWRHRAGALMLTTDTAIRTTWSLMPSNESSPRAP